MDIIALPILHKSKSFYDKEKIGVDTDLYEDSVNKKVYVNKTAIVSFKVDSEDDNISIMTMSDGDTYLCNYSPETLKSKLMSKKSWGQ